MREIEIEREGEGEREGGKKEISDEEELTI